MPVKVSSPWSKYARATAQAAYRIIGMSSGEVGTGKTHFWLTGPGPILVQSLDKGLEGVVDRIMRDQPEKGIYVREYDWDPQAAHFTQQTAIDLRDQIIADYEFGLAHARTILWDKETDIWEVFRYAEFGGPSDAPKDYARLNQRYYQLINRAKATPAVNVGFVQSMKDEWLSEKVIDRQSGASKSKPVQTGRRIRTGFSRLDELVFVELHHRRENGQFKLDIGKCRQNADLMDQTFLGMTLPELGQLIMPETREEDWA